MTQVAYREVSTFEYLGSYGATLQAQVFCSPYWQDDCCREVDTPEGRKVRISRETYPPGGKGTTAMRRCGICGKWAPHAIRDNACNDCQVEDEECSFEQRLDHLERDGWRGLAGILYQAWWQRAFVPEPKKPKRNRKKRKKTKKEKYPSGPVQGVVRSVADGKLTGYTRHGLNQAIGRDGGVGVAPRAIFDAVKNPVRVIPQAGGRIKYVGQNAKVVLNQNGQGITTWGTNSAGIRGAAGGR